MHKNLVRKPEGKIPLGRRMCSWEHNFRIDFKEIGWERVGWIHLAQSRDQWQAPVNTVMNIRVP
jgi:hypothetical protein